MHLKKIFLLFTILVIISMPITSIADDYIEESNDISIETSSSSSPEPTVNARHAVVFDRCSKTILYSKNENEKCKIASTTKILTAIIVLENSPDLNKVVSVSKKAARYRWFKIRSFF